MYIMRGDVVITCLHFQYSAERAVRIQLRAENRTLQFNLPSLTRAVCGVLLVKVFSIQVFVFGNKYEREKWAGGREMVRKLDWLGLCEILPIY